MDEIVARAERVTDVDAVEEATARMVVRALVDHDAL